MVFSDFDHQKKILITRFEGDVELIEIIDYITLMLPELIKAIREDYEF